MPKQGFFEILLLLIGYSFYSVLKKTFSVLQAPIALEFHFSKSDLGLIASTFSICYGISKFIGGILSDIFPSHQLFCIGLFLASFSNIFFSYATQLYSLCFLWGINGIVQGVGWPSLAKYILGHVEKERLGMVWSTMMFGGNIGYLLTPFFLLPILKSQGWKAAFLISGVIGISISCWIYGSMQLLESNHQSSHKLATSRTTAIYSWNENIKLINSKFQTIWLRLKELSSQLIFYLLCIMICNAITYFILKGMADWTVYYLMEYRGYSIQYASNLMFWNEIGGLIGSLSCGWLSDITCKKPLVICTVFMSICSIILLFLPSKNHQLLDRDFTTDYSDIKLLVCLFIVGFTINGPKTLLSLGLRELLPTELGGSVEGIFGLFGQLGASVSGYGIGYMVDSWGWSSFTFALGWSSFVSTVCIAIPAVLTMSERNKMVSVAKTKNE